MIDREGEVGPISSAKGRRLAQLAEIPVTELTGIGPARERALATMGIESVLDLLMHYPRRYADRSHPTLIGECVVGEEAMVEAIVAEVITRPSRARRSIVEIKVTDASGELTLTFFNQPYRKDQLHLGDDVVVFGRVEIFRNHRQMTNPIVDLVGDQTGAIIPIYPQSGRVKVTSRDLDRFVTEALKRAKGFADPIAEPRRKRLRLVDRTTAFREIHHPTSLTDRLQARRRLAFDELWRLQLALVLAKRRQVTESRGIAHCVAPATDQEGSGPDLVADFLAQLPYELTGAQRRVLLEIASDLGAEVPMHRLLQGDVGSGKTVVALATMLYGVQGGYQGALMVPTEVLAEQHFGAATELLGGLILPDPSRLAGNRPLRVELLTSATSSRNRTLIINGLREKSIDIVVGTHALLTEEVRFGALGVVVIDEQHRFGVDQRAGLREKGAIDPQQRRDPDMLVMTATPIPRTAAMTVYGDLDYSELDELPPGRTSVTTRWVRDAKETGWVWECVRTEVGRGHQAFVVCPRVHARDLVDELDESALFYLEPEEAGQLFGIVTPDGTDRPARSVIEEHERLLSDELRGLRVGLLHGQMPVTEREEVMGAFRRGDLDVLVATTVIEVGVDIPAATVMVIEDADRFGIAQLHQLRGRVGRNREESWCFLLTDGVTEKAERRLRALEATSDGFVLAETDLELRGEGTVLGVRQKGRNDLRLASLRNDRDLVVDAREVAIEMVERDPTLEESPLVAEELVLFIDDEEARYLKRG